jgi:hypothetical protein
VWMSIYPFKCNHAILMFGCFWIISICSMNWPDTCGNCSTCVSKARNTCSVAKFCSVTLCWCELMCSDTIPLGIFKYQCFWPVLHVPWRFMVITSVLLLLGWHVAILLNLIYYFAGKKLQILWNWKQQSVSNNLLHLQFFYSLDRKIMRQSPLCI